ncbi:MAG TPA: glycosyltransferase family 4 protein [Verrucomicrobiae bacterium]|nr:glycosyltransferase family 4 protein [Verrucomicrobiae bacterium]
MRTIHLLRKLDPDAWGGTEMALQRLFDSLRAQGVQSVVYCPRLDAPARAAADPIAQSGHDVRRFKAFVPVLGMPEIRKRQLISVGGNLMSFDLIPSLWREDSPSVVHTHTLGRIGAIARTFARQRRAAFVVTIHGGVLDLPRKVKEAFNEPIRDGFEWGKLFGLLFRSNRVFHDADAILTCNPKEASLWREKFPEKRVVVQPHGVEFERYEKDCRAAALEAFPRIKDRQLLVCLGRVDPIKNQAWLLEQAAGIFKEHPQSILVFAGPCTDEPYGAALDRRIQELGLGGRILLTGGLPPNDARLIGLLQLAAALILPSVSETFGLVIIEAWAAGAPVLCSGTSGATALVKPGENGFLFDLERPATFHEALRATLADPQRARRMAQSGREQARENFSLGALAARMKRLYIELMEEKLCTT